MELAGLIVPAVTPAAGAMLAEALGTGDSDGGPVGMAVGLDGQMVLADLEMQDPAFWETPESDWQRDTVAAGLGLFAGLLVASQVFRR